jgi:peptidoglycan hydrolase-like protein with peptidoglycan-binding domain
MKFLTYVFAVLFVFAPLFASADTIPAFPMALWGMVTVNGAAAPVGTVVRAYYGTTLAGQVTVQEAGVYGYTEPTKQKLVLGAGSSTVSFTFQSTSFNGGAETGGTTAVTYPQFVSGTTVNQNLAFTVDIPAPPSSGGGSSPAPVSSSGGGGGGGYIVIPTVPATTVVATTTATGSGIVTPQVPGVVLGESTYNFTLNLQLGSKGEDVTQLQNVLIAEGLLQSEATGYFGALTKAALKLYQAKYGISQTGTVGPLTRAQLNKNKSSTPSTVVIAPVSSGHVFTQNLSVGSHASDVTPLQNVLISLGLLKSEATGYYGALTKNAVMAYQAKYGISKTGTVGPLTRAQLNK